MGGVYPVSNDQRPPDGIEQAGWPMPFVNVTTAGHGLHHHAAGSPRAASPGIGADRAHRAVRPHRRQLRRRSTRRSAGDIDLGYGPARRTDCTVPAGHSAGDTKSRRSGFYELNRINEQARG